MKKIGNWFSDTGLFPFFREVFSNPATVGAAWPSSKRLAEALARQVPLDPKGVVVELGPGTGMITEALLERGIPAEKIIAIERSEALVKHLRKKFPQVTIIHGDAMHLADLLGQDASTLAAIVSSLPLRSLPRTIVEGLSKELEKVMKKESVFIQFTYHWKKEYPGLTLKLVRNLGKIVWWNFPPARVDVFHIE
ncbi:MAG: methyltransferase domain-containing protein [Proteobacteria bacterium]|nr:methyltransferase domain-containing protein [Pseudomonadota bacterium]